MIHLRRWLFAALLPFAAVSLVALYDVCHAGGEGAGLEVTLLQGHAFELDGQGPNEATPVELGDTLGVPKTVRVNQGTRLALNFPDGSVFRMAGPAMVRFQESVAVGPERVYVLEMSQGEGWLALQPFHGSHDEVEIKLPAVTLYAKKAQCRIRVGADKRCVLAVIAGEVVLRKRFTEEAAGRDMLQKADALMADAGSAPGSDKGQGQNMRSTQANGPLHPKKADEKIYRAGELVRIGVGGSLSEVDVVDELSLRNDTWALWNLARDKEVGVMLPGAVGQQE